MRGLWGAALPQATQESCLTKVKCCIRLRGSGLGFPRATVRGMRGAGMSYGTNSTRFGRWALRPLAKSSRQRSQTLRARALMRRAIFLNPKA